MDTVTVRAMDVGPEIVIMLLQIVPDIVEHLDDPLTESFDRLE